MTDERQQFEEQVDPAAEGKTPQEVDLAEDLEPSAQEAEDVTGGRRRRRRRRHRPQGQGQG